MFPTNNVIEISLFQSARLVVLLHRTFDVQLATTDSISPIGSLRRQTGKIVNGLD